MEIVVGILSLACSGFSRERTIAWIPLLTVLTAIVLARDWQLARHFKFLRGILLMVGVVALWGIPALIQTHGQFFAIGIGRHVIGRSLATMEGHGASSFGMYLLLLPFYFVTIFVSFFPWSIKLPWLIRQLRRQKKAGISNPGYSGNEIDNYLLTGIAVIFVIFTLVSTKLPHYTLPALPLLALFACAALARSRVRYKSRLLVFRTIATSTTCVCIAIALVIPHSLRGFFPPTSFFANRTRICKRTRNLPLSSSRNQVWFGIFARGIRLSHAAQQKECSRLHVQSGPRFVIVPTSAAGTLFADPPQDWKMFSTRGFNVAKGKFVDLTLVLKPE